MITQMTSKLIPWRISQARRAFMAPIIAALDTYGEFWRTWATVYGANK